MKTYIKIIFVCIFFVGSHAFVHAQKIGSGNVSNIVEFYQGLNRYLFGGSGGPASKLYTPKTQPPTLYKWKTDVFNRVQGTLYGQNPALGNFSKQLGNANFNYPKTSYATYVNPQQVTLGVSQAFAQHRKTTVLDPLIAVNQDWATDALDELHREQQHYMPEIIAAQELRQQLLQVTELTPQTVTQLQAAVDGLNSETLRGYLTSYLETGNLASFYQDLTDYYTLDGNPVQSSFNYTLRHPHKPNLWTRRFMRSPLVDPKLRAQTGKILNENEFTPEKEAQFWTLLNRTVNEYESSLRVIYSSEPVGERIAFYRQTTQALGDFIQANGRRPKRNTANPEERKLYHSIRMALDMKATAKPEPFASELKKLQDLWNANEPIWWTEEETLQHFEAFLRQNPTSYPQSLQDNPNVSAEETELLDNLDHWYGHSPRAGTFVRRVNDLRDQYHP